MRTMNRTCIVLLLVVALLTACRGGQSEPRTFTIGVVNLSPAIDIEFDGFKDGMAEAGYVEGENVTYIYEGAVVSIGAIEPAVQNVLTEDVDLIFAITTPVALAVKRATEETGTPVLFAPVTDPVGSGVVDSLINPGGNLTGIRSGGNIPKQLEWTLAIAPDTKRLYVLHNPDDASSIQALGDLKEAIVIFDVELVIVEVRTPDEVKAALASIPEEVDAIFWLAAGLFSGNVASAVEASIEHKLPLSTGPPLFKVGALMSYGIDYYKQGKQASRLAVRMLEGTDPSDLPVEQSDFYLGINLQTAQAIGLDIPDDILQQADEIVR